MIGENPINQAITLVYLRVREGLQVGGIEKEATNMHPYR